MFIKEMQHLATGMQPVFLSKNFAKILTLRTFVGLLKLGSREKNPTGFFTTLGVFTTKAGHTYQGKVMLETKNWLEMG